MKLALLPELTEQEKTAMREWVQAALTHEELSPPDVYFPLDGKVAIYRDGWMKILRRGEHWMDDGARNLYIGWNYRRGTGMEPLERLTVIGALISVAELWDEFHEAYIARAAVILIANYQGVMSGLVQAEAAVTGLAFNADRSIVAGKIGDCYHLPNGERVEIDDTWTLVPDRPAMRAATV